MVVFAVVLRVGCFRESGRQNCYYFFFLGIHSQHFSKVYSRCILPILFLLSFYLIFRKFVKVRTFKKAELKVSVISIYSGLSHYWHFFFIWMVIHRSQMKWKWKWKPLQRHRADMGLVVAMEVGSCKTISISQRWEISVTCDSMSRVGSVDLTE